MALLVLLPCLLISLVRFRERERFALALFAVGGVLVVSASLRYNVWISRFLLPSYLAAVPLAGLFLKRRVGRFAVLALVILGAFPMLFYTQQKPIVGSDVLTMYRADQMSLIEPDRAQVIRAVDREVPKGGRLGYIGSEDSWEYPYFGPHLDRKLVKLTTADVKPGIFELYDLDAFLVAAPVDPGLAAWLQTPIPGWRLAGDLLNKPNNETNPTPSFLFTPTEAP
jgi:hypothetical protein